jgi:hypothetical protein
MMIATLVRLMLVCGKTSSSSCFCPIFWIHSDISHHYHHCTISQSLCVKMMNFFGGLLWFFWIPGHWPPPYPTLCWVGITF